MTLSRRQRSINWAAPRQTKASNYSEPRFASNMSNKFINSIFFVRHGGDERIYRLEFVSNQPFSDNEFIRWKESLQKEVSNHHDHLFKFSSRLNSLLTILLITRTSRFPRSVTSRRRVKRSSRLSIIASPTMTLTR